MLPGSPLKHLSLCRYKPCLVTPLTSPPPEVPASTAPSSFHHPDSNLTSFLAHPSPSEALAQSLFFIYLKLSGLSLHPVLLILQPWFFPGHLGWPENSATWLQPLPQAQSPMVTAGISDFLKHPIQNLHWSMKPWLNSLAVKIFPFSALPLSRHLRAFQASANWIPWQYSHLINQKISGISWWCSG